MTKPKIDAKIGRPIIDLTGKQFEKWTVLGIGEHPRKWLCQCECGTISAVFGGNLKSHQSKSCVECAKKRRAAVFFPGAKFGKWTLISRADISNAHGMYRFKCICVCGREQLVWGTSLRSGKSAGCRKCADIHGAKKRITHGYSVKQTKDSKPLYGRFYRYGITPDEYSGILERQYNLCAICTACLKKKRPPHLDHCHRTGRIRGILCSNCNNGIWHFKNSPTRLKRAINYLNNTSDARQRTECLT